MAGSSQPGRSAASRLFAVLNAFDHSRPTMNLTGISNAAELPIATTFRIVGELVNAGAIERNDDGTYQVGLRLWEIGSLAPRQRDLRRVARPLMENLYEVANETVQLAVPDRDSAVCVEKISGTRSASNVSEVGGPLPLHASAVGKVFLAFCEMADGAVSFPTELRAFTPKTIVDPAVLETELQRVRTQFVGLSREEFTLRTWSVAAPVFDDEMRLVAALGILTRFPAALRQLGLAVRTAALTISQRMGYRASNWPAAR